MSCEMVSDLQLLYPVIQNERENAVFAYDDVASQACPGTHENEFTEPAPIYVAANCTWP